MNIGNKNIKTNKNLSINFNKEMKNLSQKPEKKRYLEKNEKTRLLTYDFIPDSTYNKLPDEDNLKYNNIAYKEIKYENKYESSSNSIYSRKNKSLKNIHFSKNNTDRPLYKTIDILENNFASISSSRINPYIKNINKTINDNNKKINTKKNEIKINNKKINLKINNKISKNNYNNTKSYKQEKNKVNENNLSLKEGKKYISNEPKTFGETRKKYIKPFKIKGVNKENNENKKYIKNICKIQAIIKGRNLRKLMIYYWISIKFNELLTLTLFLIYVCFFLEFNHFNIQKGKSY